MSATSPTCPAIINRILPVYLTNQPVVSDIADWASPNGNVITPTIHTPNTQLPYDYNNETKQLHKMCYQIKLFYLISSATILGDPW